MVQFRFEILSRAHSALDQNSKLWEENQVFSRQLRSEILALAWTPALCSAWRAALDWQGSKVFKIRFKKSLKIVSSISNCVCKLLNGEGCAFALLQWILRLVFSFPIFSGFFGWFSIFTFSAVSQVGLIDGFYVNLNQNLSLKHWYSLMVFLILIATVFSK